MPGELNNNVSIYYLNLRNSGAGDCVTSSVLGAGGDDLMKNDLFLLQFIATLFHLILMYGVD